MIPEDPLGIIELGNKNISCLIFKINDNNESEILSTSITPSEGIYNDVVVNLGKASNSIRLCIGAAEKKAKVSLKKINVVFEQPDFLCTNFSKHKKIDGSKIDRVDIEFLLKEAKKQLILNDKHQSIIHIFNYNYIVDEKTFVEEPIGVYANSLTHEITFITAPKNNLKNINQAFIDCDLEIERLISRTFTLGVKLFNDKELEFGSVLINLENEKISLGIFKNLALIYSITLPIGINHLAKDISKVCSLNQDESESIINSIDFSFKKNKDIFEKNNYLKNSYFTYSNYRKISKDLVVDVIKSRLDEICNIIKKELVISGLNLDAGINTLLFGESSDLINLEIYFLNFFGHNVRKVSKSSDIEDIEKNFAPSLGALKIIKDGWETEAIAEISDKNKKKISFFGKIFNNYW